MQNLVRPFISGEAFSQQERCEAACRVVKDAEEMVCWLLTLAHLQGDVRVAASPSQCPQRHFTSPGVINCKWS